MYGTHCPIDDDHSQHFDLSDLNNGIYYCDTCKRPLMALVDGNLHNVQPVATIINVG
jgi:uncharacterized protein YuzB (UPF0349 family)